MTTDERLAALEAKMDALTAPPSDYYTSRYSGEEIDAAIAAVADKADKTQLCNPNLLDNWYFSNLVNQRGGYISLQGVPVYHDAAFTNFMGNQAETAATCIKSGTNYQRIINGQGAGYVKAADVVRGYVGAGYGIDRWFAGFPGTVVTVQSDHVSIAPPAGNYFGWMNYFEADSLLGQTVTFSALCRYTGSGSTILPYITAYIGNNQFADTAQINQTTWQCISFTLTFPTAKPSDGRFGFDVVAMQNFGVDIKAVKLELGSQQTLARQDADGNWVLNEVPDYGEQLRRCQRYFYRLKSQNGNNYGVLALGYLQSNAQGRFLVNFPNTMRTVPTYSMSGTLQIYSKSTGYAVTSLSHQSFNGNALLLVANCAANENFVVGNTAHLSAMNDANAYIDFSADL